MKRRRFIASTAKAAGAVSLVVVAPESMGANTTAKTYTVQDVMGLILKEIPGAPFTETVDTLKSGSADAIVTGIVTTMFSTIAIIKEAIRLNANFIIAHEPTFYNHTDDPNWAGANDVVTQKQELLLKNNITVWRFHDYWHTYVPDGILNGVVKKAGWEKFYRNNSAMMQLPATSLKDIATHLKSKLAIDHVRVIGNLSKKCERIALLPGAWGGQKQIEIAEKEKPDVLIVGEVHEWETAEYIRDARLLGKDISLIVLGHSVSEEPGMHWLVEWLQPKLNGIEVTHVASNSPFVWL